MKINIQNMNFTVDTIQKVSVKIRYNLELYLDLYSYFIQNNQSLITEYFTSRSAKADSDSFQYLAQLIDQSNTINGLISIHKDSFDMIDEWELIDFLEDVKISLLTIDNTSKYTRSVKSKNSWQITGVKTYYTLGQNKTLEDASVDALSSDNWDDDWVDLALNNQLSEEDYDSQGGNVLEIDKGINYLGNLFLNSVVDNLYGQRLYGRDFSKKIQFVDNDIFVLNYNDTFLQSVDILVKLKKGDIPEFRNMGSDYVVGSNMGVFEYGRVRRQISTNMATDDTIQNFTILSFNYTNGDMYVNYSVDSFYNITYNQTVKTN